MTALLPHPALLAPRPDAADSLDFLCGGIESCGENFRLRQEYIDALAAFNETAARHRMVLRAGVQGAAFEHSWHRFRKCCVASREAWARYRKHAAAHGCQRA